MSKTHVLLILVLLIFGNILVSSANPVYVHYSFDWEGDGENESGLVGSDESCVVCHLDLMQMVASRDLMNVCEDCHLEGSRGPFSRDNMQVRDDMNEITPFIYSHYNGSKNVDVFDQSGVFNGTGMSSCFGLDPKSREGSCHGVTFGFSASADNFFSFNEGYIGNLKNSDPYMWNAPVEKMPDTSDCRFCHLQENATIRKVWGGAGDINPVTCNDTTNEGCWNCHAGGVEPESFHSVNVFKVKIVDDSEEKEGLGMEYGLLSVFVILVSYVFLRKNGN